MGESLDLSSLVSADDVATYTWKYAYGTPVPAEAYTVSDGVTTFTSALDSAVYCEITSTLFPKLTGASAYKTTMINVVAKEGSAIDEAAAEAPVKVYAASGRIVVENVEPSETIAVYALSGVKCAERVMEGSRMEWEMPQGIYIVVAGTETARVVVR